jgi:hypothetical protein
MKNTFTPDELLLFTYQESNRKQTLDITRMLKAHPELRSDLEELAEERQLLDFAFSGPSKEADQNIMSYSLALVVVETISSGQHHILLN